MDTSEVLLIIFGNVVLISLVAIIGGFLHARRGRLLVHEERMKALELGREWPDDPATARLKAIQEREKPDTPEAATSEKSLPVQVYTITGWTSGCGLLFAAWCSAGGGVGVPVTIALAAGAVGVTGMICGTILASKMITAPSVDQPISPFTKPRFDPESV